MKGEGKPGGEEWDGDERRKKNEREGREEKGALVCGATVVVTASAWNTAIHTLIGNGIRAPKGRGRGNGGGKGAKGAKGNKADPWQAKGIFVFVLF